MAGTKKKANVDFTATLGKERKEKFIRIAESENRTMSGQLKAWIDNTPDPIGPGNSTRK